jgi:hypothetical protein
VSGYLLALAAVLAATAYLAKRFGTQPVYRVEYGHISHFTREYKRLFGATPMHDVEQLRYGAAEHVVHGTV